MPQPSMANEVANLHATLQAGTLSNRHEELQPLAEAAGDLARAIVAAVRPGT